MLGGKALDLLTPATTGIGVDGTRCTRLRFARSGCRRCEEECPSGALILEKGPRIDHALCTVCRGCEAACPAGALQGDERDLSTLATSLAQYPRPILGCREPGVQAHVHTGCLGFLEIEGLLALSFFFPEGLTLNLSRCRQCRNGRIVPGLEAALEKLQSLHGNPGGGRLRLAETAEEVSYQDIDLSRREFFTFLRKRSADAATVAAARLQQTAPRPDGSRKVLPAHRRLLLRALPLMPADIRCRVEAELFPSLRFRETCTGCTGCAGICPTGAIAVSAADPPRPTFLRHFCTGCRLCAEFCRKGGIELS